MNKFNESSDSRVRMLFRDSDSFLASIQTLYRMDRGDRIYVKRHFRRWLETAEILETIGKRKGLMSVLDVGCGSGFFMLMFGGKLIGLDSAENVDVCAKRGLQAYAVDLEKDQFPLRDQIFDAAVCLEVLEHLADPNNILDEINRTLKSGGYLIISTPNGRMPTWQIRDSLFKFRIVSRIYMNRELREDEKRYSKEELEQLLISHNFEVQAFNYPRILLPTDDLLAVAKKCR